MYVDPSTGPLLTQLLVSAGIGTVIGFRNRLARLWKRLVGTSSDAPPQAPSVSEGGHDDAAQ